MMGGGEVRDSEWGQVMRKPKQVCTDLAVR